MNSQSIDIAGNRLVTDIVAEDYRTASVFYRYSIDFCCGGKLALQAVCDMRGLDIHQIKNELNNAVRYIQVPGSIGFSGWSADFLIDYIINVHHSYLLNAFPEIVAMLERFAQGHQAKYPYFAEVLDYVLKLRDELLPHLEQEEKIIFPYIRQVAHAYENNEPYAALLVRTLRKPIEHMMDHEHVKIGKYLYRIRELTHNYMPAANACMLHKVSLFKLKELDNDLVQHVYLEGNILFPKAVAMENEMLDLK
jgi:regulator of cell morphogenesis and NO signaling